MNVIAKGVLPQPVLKMQPKSEWTVSDGHVHLRTGLASPMLCSCGSTCILPEQKRLYYPCWRIDICSDSLVQVTGLVVCNSDGNKKRRLNGKKRRGSRLEREPVNEVTCTWAVERTSSHLHAACPS